MRPDRILLAELRAEEAFDYLRNVNSGHPGSITSVAGPGLVEAGPVVAWLTSVIVLGALPRMVTSDAILE